MLGPSAFALRPRSRVRASGFGNRFGWTWWQGWSPWTLEPAHCARFWIVPMSRSDVHCWPRCSGSAHPRSSLVRLRETSCGLPRTDPGHVSARMIQCSVPFTMATGVAFRSPSIKPTKAGPRSSRWSNLGPVAWGALFRAKRTRPARLSAVPKARPPRGATDVEAQHSFGREFPLDPARSSSHS